MSYVRAGQQADKYLISKELERKAIHNLTKEVIYAYWKTLSADELLAEINPLMERVNTALDDYEYIEWDLVAKKMVKPAWVFDARSIVNGDLVKKSGMNMWSLGDGS